MSASRDLPGTVRRALQDYLRELDGEDPGLGVYDMVVKLIERPMLEVIMDHAKGNQKRCAAILGINRNTLRMKLVRHGLLEKPKNPPRRALRKA